MAEEGETVQALTSKEIKKLIRPEFEANPDKYYPTETLKKLGYHRAKCPEAGVFFWRRTEKQVTCGDSDVGDKKYKFIGKGTKKGFHTTGKRYTYGDAWAGFKRIFTTNRIPCTPIDRYPVVARWRADVDFTAAGIFCFQPFCVTGEMEPPANPLIQPQFCLRFNDLDNIGITGRHYSGFIMQGIQVFNRKDNKKFWSDECVEFNYRWLTEELLIDPDEITFIEDVWAGGGNLGPSIEYFVGGLELGNMVFMQFKTFPDGRIEPLEVQVIDCGIGLERVPWLVNGSGTSYMDVFKSSLDYLKEKINVDIDGGIWDSFGPYSCQLNVDEVEDLDATWKWISEQVGKTPDEIKEAIDPVKEMYVVLDHTRSVLMAVFDGSLPSNVGGASNVRNILRRTFASLHKRGWWEKLGMEGFLELFEKHKQDLASVFGPFAEYKSFNDIIKLEYERWCATDAEQKEKLKRLIKKKGGKLGLEDWINCVTSWGLPADLIAKETGSDPPGDLWFKIAERAERSVKTQPTVLYSTYHLAPTESLYYDNHKLYEFEGTILEVFPNVSDKNTPSIVVLDKSAFYPTSGGQEHDTGSMTIEGTKYDVVDVMKVGPCVLHVISPPLPKALEEYKGVKVTGLVDEERRDQLRNNHTATHILFAACRQVLGPHVWQQGAKKTVEQAHLDITHYQSLTEAETGLIQKTANQIVRNSKQITKGFMSKDIAEKKYGFSLYQGGVVPGNNLRVVDIAGTDTEACCGTHADNTAEVGLIKIIKSSRISDGVVRLNFVAGEKALDLVQDDTNILNTLCGSWGVNQSEITTTAERFFEGYKSLGSKASKNATRILELNMKVFLADSEKLMIVKSDAANPTMFISTMPGFAKALQDAGKGVVFIGKTFLYGLLGDPSVFDAKKILEPAFAQLATELAEKEKEAQELIAKDKDSKEAQKLVKQYSSKDVVKGGQKAAKLVVKNALTVKPDKKKPAVKQLGKSEPLSKPLKVTGVSEFSCFTLPVLPSGVVAPSLVEAFTTRGFVEYAL